MAGPWPQRYFRVKPYVLFYEMCRAMGAGGALAEIAAWTAVELSPDGMQGKKDGVVEPLAKTAPLNRAICLPGFLIVECDLAPSFLIMDAWDLASVAVDEYDAAIPWAKKRAMRSMTTGFRPARFLRRVPSGSMNLTIAQFPGKGKQAKPAGRSEHFLDKTSGMRH